MSANELPNLRVGDVQCSPEGLESLQDNRVIQHVLFADIQSISLRFGKTAKHPLLLFLTGLVLIAIGVLPAIHLVNWITHGGVFFFWEGFIIAFGLLGAYFTWESAQSGNYLEVRTNRGKLKFAFSRQTPPEKIHPLLQAVEQRLPAHRST